MLKFSDHYIDILIHAVIDLKKNTIIKVTIYFIYILPYIAIEYCTLYN